MKILKNYPGNEEGEPGKDAELCEEKSTTKSHQTRLKVQTRNGNKFYLGQLLAIFKIVD